MPNSYKGSGTLPTLCLDSPIPPDLSDSPSGGSADAPMVSASDPFQPCGPPGCPSGSCCGSGGGSGGGGFGGGPSPGGGLGGGFGGGLTNLA
jgi:hypothetical protein